MSSPGDYYDRKRKRAAQLRRDLADERAKPDPDDERVRLLKERLDLAEYVGD